MDTIATQKAELNALSDALEKAFQANLVMQLLSHSPQEVKNALIENNIAVPDWLEEKCS